MNLNKLIPMLYTIELNESVDFYVEKLGFTCIANEPDWGWARVRHDQVDLMLSLPNDHIPFHKATFTGSFYFETEEVDHIWNNLHREIKVCYPIENFDYGMREFAIYDNNGYLLQFGQEIATEDY